MTCYAALFQAAKIKVPIRKLMLNHPKGVHNIGPHVKRDLLLCFQQAFNVADRGVFRHPIKAIKEHLFGRDSHQSNA